MPCREPIRRPRSRLSLAAVTLSLSALAAAGCDRKTAEPDPGNVQAEAPAAPREAAAPTVPLPPPALTRSDLIRAAEQAASAYAQGTTPTSPDDLVGRSFAVRVAFGCGGPAPAERPEDKGAGLPEWRWGPEQKSIQLRMTPSDWTESAMLAKASASDKWEAVEGFWLPRPWLSTETCAVVRPDPLQTGAPPASPQTVGLAAVFETGGSRIGRRNGRAYEHTIRGEGDTPPAPPEAGYRMLLEGRIASFPSGRAIECNASGPDQRPVCIVAIRLDRLAYQDADGATLSEWRPG